MAKHIIIDTSYLIFRSFFSFTSSLNRLTDSEGKPTSAIFGFAKSVMNLVRDLDTRSVIFALDMPGKKTWRDKIFADYKAGRPPIQEDMRVQIKPILDWVHKISTNVFGYDGYEADDVIYTAARQIFNQDPNSEIYIFSSDKDLYQLLQNSCIKFIRINKGVMGFYTMKDFAAETGLTADQWIDYKALVGDKGDNLRGVSGIGPKTACQILTQVGSLHKLFENMGWDNLLIDTGFEVDQDKLNKFIADPKNLRWVEKIFNDRDYVLQTQKLAQLHDITEVKLRDKEIDFNLGIEDFEKYGFGTLLNQLGKGLRKQSKLAQNDENALF